MKSIVNSPLFEGEVFKPVFLEAYKKRYEISNFGRIKSVNTDYVTYGYNDTLGYMSVKLRNGKANSKTVRIHTLVANAFLEKPTNIIGILMCNHIDGNKKNNHISNLEWTNSKGNSEHAVATGLSDWKGEKHHNAKLTELQILEMRELYHTHSQEQLAIKFNISRGQVKDIINGSCWSHLPLQDYSQRTIGECANNFRNPKYANSFTDSQVLEIRELYHTKALSEISNIFNVPPQTIYAIVTGKIFKKLPLQDYSKRKKSIRQPSNLLTNEQVLEIRELYHKESASKIATKFNVSSSYIYNIVTGKLFPNLPIEKYALK